MFIDQYEMSLSQYLKAIALFMEGSLHDSFCRLMSYISRMSLDTVLYVHSTLAFIDYYFFAECVCI